MDSTFLHISFLRYPGAHFFSTDLPQGKVMVLYWFPDGRRQRKDEGFLEYLQASTKLVPSLVDYGRFTRVPRYVPFVTPLLRFLRRQSRTKWYAGHMKGFKLGPAFAAMQPNHLDDRAMLAGCGLGGIIALLIPAAIAKATHRIAVWPPMRLMDQVPDLYRAFGDWDKIQATILMPEVPSNDRDKEKHWELMAELRLAEELARAHPNNVTVVTLPFDGFVLEAKKYIVAQQHKF